jgi:hypothetical protein
LNYLNLPRNISYYNQRSHLCLYDAQRFACMCSSVADQKRFPVRLALIFAVYRPSIYHCPRYWHIHAVSGSLLLSVHCVTQFGYPASKLSSSQ